MILLTYICKIDALKEDRKTNTMCFLCCICFCLHNLISTAHIIDYTNCVLQYVVKCGVMHLFPTIFSFSFLFSCTDATVPLLFSILSVANGCSVFRATGPWCWNQYVECLPLRLAWRQYDVIGLMRPSGLLNGCLLLLAGSLVA